MAGLFVRHANARRGLVLLAALCLSGCYAARSSSPLPLRAEYEAADGFFLVPRATGDRGGIAPCRVQHAEVDAPVVRGDTIVFASVRSARPLRGQRACTLSGPGYIDLASSPGLVRLQRQPDGFGTGLALLFTLPGVIGLALLLSAL